jgi:hypothetical protein
MSDFKVKDQFMCIYFKKLIEDVIVKLLKTEKKYLYRYPKVFVNKDNNDVYFTDILNTLKVKLYLINLSGIKDYVTNLIKEFDKRDYIKRIEFDKRYRIYIHV